MVRVAIVLSMNDVYLKKDSSKKKKEFNRDRNRYLELQDSLESEGKFVFFVN